MPIFKMNGLKHAKRAEAQDSPVEMQCFLIFTIIHRPHTTSVGDAKSLSSAQVSQRLHSGPLNGSCIKKAREGL